MSGAPGPRFPGPWVLPCTFVLLAVNLAIVAPLTGVEYSAYNGSIEGTFIAIPRVMAAHPGEWSWWPLWNGGLPFENVYLPFSHWLVAVFTVLTGLPVARSFHIVTAGAYALGSLAMFWMALVLSRKLWASFIAALAYSCLSPSALLVPAIAADAGGMLNLRRLHILVFWGESPHTVALALLPVAIVCFSRALTTGAAKWRLLAGVLAACVVLSNAFGIVALAMALFCWLLAFPSMPWWKAPLTAAAIGVAAWCWVSPWLSPRMIRAMEANAATTGGGFGYTAATWIALALLGAGFVLLCRAMRRVKAPAHVQFFALLGCLPTGVVFAWTLWNVTIIPQPGRYQLEMDLFLLPGVVFAGAAIVERFPKRVRCAVAAACMAGLAVQTAHSALYARHLIRSVDPATLSEYKVARWLDRNRPGERAFLSGSGSFLFNAFTDNPQLHGGHDQHTVNRFIPIVSFVVYSGMNAGDRDAEYSIFWLKAFGAHTVYVPGPGSTEHYRPFAHPRKFEGVLPVLWRDGGDVIYAVPARSKSLAHVMPASAVPARTPIHGLDIAPAQAYVAALDDPRLPPA